MARSTTAFAPGDRVSLHGGQIGRVVERIYRNRPPFAGLLVEFHDARGESYRREVAHHQVHEPHRPLLEAWRSWNQKDQGMDYLGLLSPARLARFQVEWSEEHRRRGAEWVERFMPRPAEGYVPHHDAAVTKTTERHRTWSSNGAHERMISRHFWWLSCPCGYSACVESAAAARSAKAEHDGPDRDRT